MENAMVSAVTKTEEECAYLKKEALMKKEKTISSAKEKINAMELEFENLSKIKKKQTLDDVKIKNDEVMQKEIENGKKVIENLRIIAQDKEKGAISLVMSCIA